MSLETAFLLRVLFGQWLVLFALWRLSVTLMRIYVSSMITKVDHHQEPDHDIILVPPEDKSDWG
jgi:hypothetical protein